MLLLWWLIAGLNDYLGPHGVYLYAGGLLVAFAALRLSLRHGLAATALLGLAIDAVEPVPVFGGHPFYGLNLLLLVTVHVIIFQVRWRFPREDTVVGVATALVANLVLFFAVSLAFVGMQPLVGVAVWRLLSDFFWSELLVVLIAPWFFALQLRAYELARVDMADERRRSF